MWEADRSFKAVGFLPENVGIEALEDGKIIKVPLIEKIPQRQICLVESKRTPLSIAANALKQFINNYIETKLKDKAWLFKEITRYVIKI